MGRHSPEQSYRRSKRYFPSRLDQRSPARYLEPAAVQCQLMEAAERHPEVMIDTAAATCDAPRYPARSVGVAL